MKLLIMTILISLLAASCSQKAKQTNVKLSLGKIFGSGSFMYGGVLLMGHTIDDQEGFTTFILNASTDLQLDLKKGKWEFLAIGWQGAEPNGNIENFLTGNHQCGYVGPIDLNNDQTNISFNLSYDGCMRVPNHGAVLASSSFMGNTANANVNQFLQLEVLSCKTVDYVNKRCLNDSGTPSDTSYGLTRSVRFAIEGNYKSAAGNRSLPGFLTTCYPTATGDTGGLNIRFPAGNPDLTEKVAGIKLQLFTSNDCSGSPIIYNFNDKAMAQGINNTYQKAIAVPFGGSPSLTRILVEHNANTVSNMNGYNKFGYGVEGDVTISTVVNVNPEDYARVIGFSSDTTTGNTILGLSSVDGASIAPYDSILLYVNDNRGGGCGTNATSFQTGLMLTAQVLSKTASPNILVLDRDIRRVSPSITLDYPATSTNWGNGLDKTVACSIQVVKIRQYKNLTINSDAYLQASAFDSNSHKGGILAFKVSENFNVLGTSSIPSVIEASARGFLNHTPTLGNCTNMPCMQMGSSNNASIRGGGLIIADIARLNFVGAGSPPSAKLIIKNDGEVASTTLIATDVARGGHTNIYVGELVNSLTSGSDINITSTTNAGKYLSSFFGNPGPGYFEVCHMPFDLTLASIASGSAIGSSGNVIGNVMINNICRQ